MDAASPVLDIIVPHYTEPFEIGRKFFEILKLQRGVNYNSFRVTLVNDGEENAFKDELFESLPFPFRQINIPHAGVSAARNAGLDAATAEWVMFCDFDDMFSSVYSMKFITESISGKTGFDVLWTERFNENTKESDPWSLSKSISLDTVFVHAKIYRREALNRLNYRFNEKLRYNEDSEFNCVLLTMIDYKRTGRINIPIVPYAWICRSGSTSNENGRRSEALRDHYIRNKNVTEAYRKYLPYERLCGMVTRTVFDTYFCLHTPRSEPEILEIRRDFRKWYARYKGEFLKVDDSTLREIVTISWQEYSENDIDNHAYDLVVSGGPIDTKPILDWLELIMKEEI